jgi:hypothetical protein
MIELKENPRKNSKSSERIARKEDIQLQNLAIFYNFVYKN